MYDEVLKALLPVSTPLNLVLIAAIVWLAKDRGRLVEALDTAHKELAVEINKRAECLEKIYQEFMERGEEAMKLMAEFSQKASQILSRADR